MVEYLTRFMGQLNSKILEIINITYLTNEAFILTLDGNYKSFVAGQHFVISVINDHIEREYSVYSAENDGSLQFLVKEVEDGSVSPRLKDMKKGDSLSIRGPYGKFGLNKMCKNSHKHVFIATGTGIAPFHSIVKSYEGINYQIIHGVRYSNEAYEKHEYERSRYTLCTSNDTGGDFSGRLTFYLQSADFEKNTCFYLCGNSEMIYDGTAILKEKGFENRYIETEVYF